MTDPVAFVLSVIALLAVPGPTNTLLATAGGLGGVRRAVALIPAEVAGYLLAIGLITVVLRPVLVAWPQAAASLRALGGIVLVALAVRLWRRGAVDRLGDGSGTPSIRAWHVFVTTLLNPKAAVFYIAVLPEFVQIGRGTIAAQTLMLSAIYVAVATTIHLSIVLLAARLQTAIETPDSRRTIRRVLAMLLAVIAIWFAVSTERN